MDCLGLYSLLALLFTLLVHVVAQSFHYISITLSGEKSLSSGPSTLISRRSHRVDVWSLVRLSVLITFSVEKILSTRPLENGRLNKS